MTRIRARGAIFALIVVLAAALAGCGGGDGGGGEDPSEVLDQTFNNPKEISSGRVKISLEGSAEGSQAGNLTATIEGPFQTDKKDPAAFPQLDLSAEISASATGGLPFDFTGGFVATEDSAFVEYQGQAYDVGASFFNRLKALSEQSVRRAQARENASIFERLGIEPQNWLTNVSNEGGEDVEGTETIHIHGDADIEQIVTDLATIAQRAPDAAVQALDPAQVDEVEAAIKEATVDVYSGKDDRVLRRLSLSLTIEPPTGSGDLDVSNVVVDFSLTLSDVNAPQTITAPSGAKPISGLLGGLGLGDLGVPSPSGGNGGAGGDGGPSQGYLDCIRNNPADPGKCVSRL